MMQWVDDRESPYGCRLVCSGADIDDIMEERYLRFYKGACNMAHPAIDLDRFTDEALAQEDIGFDAQAELSKFILGATMFNPDGSKLIQINAILYHQRNTPAFKGRFRFTCAHEIFHALFHGQLFRNAGDDRTLRCFENHFEESTIAPSMNTRDFIEWQANRGAAALLMPVSIFKEKVRQFRSKSHNQNALLQDLMGRFDVSKQSAELRLKTLGLLILPGDDFVLEHDGIDSYEDHRRREWH